jgi:prevent-host-death family protein
MVTRVTATEVARSFSDVLNRVRYRGEEFVVERGGEPVCRIVPVEVARPRLTLRELAGVLATVPSPDEEYLDEVESMLAAQPLAPDPSWPR